MSEFRYYRFGSGYQHLLSQRTLLEFDASASFFETLNNDDVESDSYAVQAGFTRAQSEQLQFRALAGVSYTKTDETTTVGPLEIDSSDDNFGFTFVASADYVFDERTSFGISASQAIEPSADGDLVERRRANVSATHQWGPLLSFQLSAFYIGNRDAGGKTTSDRDFFNVEPSVRWRMARDWFLSARYRYRTEKKGDRDDWVDGNGVFLAITYQAPEWSFAR